MAIHFETKFPSTIGDSRVNFQDFDEAIKHDREILVLRLWDFGQKVIRENVLVVPFFHIYTSRSDFHLSSHQSHNQGSTVSTLRYLYSTPGHWPRDDVI